MRLPRLQQRLATLVPRARLVAAAIAVLVTVGSVPVGMAMGREGHVAARHPTPESVGAGPGADAARWPDVPARRAAKSPEVPLAQPAAASGARPAPAPAEVVTALGRGGIPQVALAAYLRAQATMAFHDPACGLRWSLLAGIGRVESDHGRFGGARLTADGDGTRPIRGIALDGRPGVARIGDTDRGALDGDRVFDRAVGPMQFIPSTWRLIAVDGNGDGRSDPGNLYDAALGAGVYLCAGGADLRRLDGRHAAVLRYNRSATYTATVLALAEAYEHDLAGTLPPPGAPVAALLPPVTARLPAATAGRPPGLAARAAPAPDRPAPATPPGPGPATTTVPGPPTTTTAPEPVPTTTTAPEPVPTTTAPEPIPTTEPPPGPTTAPATVGGGDAAGTTVTGADAGG